MGVELINSDSSIEVAGIPSVAIQTELLLLHETRKKKIVSIAKLATLIDLIENSMLSSLY